jgi:adenine C2-methylase RlmN of 23S rRNA A2503 and tRNA A37
MLTEVKSKSFSNGSVYAIRTIDGHLIETTDTFLPMCTKYCKYDGDDIGSRSERWMIGVSVMSGCPVGCKFCATGNMGRYRNLSASEILEQHQIILRKNTERFGDAKEHKINYTRMGEPFLNIEAVREAIEAISNVYPKTHHYVSTIGIRGSDFSWIKGNITLQISLHSLDESRRNSLIPFANKMSIEELGRIRTQSNLKTTVNLSLVDNEDFDINVLKEYFDPEFFFIKLSPINENAVSLQNQVGGGVINGRYS